MKKAKTYLVRTFAAAMVVALLMINIHVDVEPPFSVDNIGFTMNEAEASMEPDFQLVWRNCPSGSQAHKYCKPNENTDCNVSSQTVCD